MASKTMMFDGRPMYCLVSAGDMAIVDMHNGMNLVRYTRGGKEIIHYDRERYLAGKTYGNPILFPTPNRIANSTYHFEGSEYQGLAHGIVRNEPFTLVETQQTPTMAAIHGKWELDENHPLYHHFPWHCSLTVRIVLSSEGLEWTYTVANLEQERPLGFGFALHPFFTLQTDRMLTVSAPFIMEASETGYPTGNLLPVAGSNYDLRNPTKVSECDLDTVYYDPTQPAQGTIQFGPKEELTLIGSEEFNHIVIYTPQHADFFCIENQSCAADTHNLYAQGYTKPSGLLVLEAGCMHKGNITWSWSDFDHI